VDCEGGKGKGGQKIWVAFPIIYTSTIGAEMRNNCHETNVQATNQQPIHLNTLTQFAG